MTYSQLIEIAEKAREQSYSPYSGYTVGAAVLCADGEVFVGCNIENASYTPTCCAERVALFKAISEGKREFRAIAVSGSRRGERGEDRCYPCGVCRQVMSEFCSPQLDIIFYDGSVTTLGELLPNSFKLKS